MFTLDWYMAKRSRLKRDTIINYKTWFSLFDESQELSKANKKIQPAIRQRIKSTKKFKCLFIYTLYSEYICSTFFLSSFIVFWIVKLSAAFRLIIRAGKRTYNRRDLQSDTVPLRPNLKLYWNETYVYENLKVFSWNLVLKIVLLKLSENLVLSLK